MREINSNRRRRHRILPARPAVIAIQRKQVHLLKNKRMARYQR